MDGEHSVCVISNCFEPLVGLCKEIQRTCLIIRYGESSFSSLTVTSGFVSNLLSGIYLRIVGTCTVCKTELF